MNLRNITLAFLGLIGLFASCNSDTEYDLTTASKDAQISSFSLTGVHDKTLDSLGRVTDSLRFIVLGKTKFSIDQLNGTIYNPDSLPYGFTLKTLLPAIKYVSSPYSVAFEMKGALKAGVADTTYQWNGSDSINFAYKQISIEVVPATGNSDQKKIYKLDIRIHKLDPDSIAWNRVGEFSKSAYDRKAVLSGESITTLTKTLSAGYVLEVVKDAGSTIVEKNISGLPSNAKVLSFNYFGDTFYVLSDDGKTFKSENGEIWNEMNNGKNVKEIVGVAPGSSDSENRIIVLLNNGSAIHFGATTDFSTIDQLTEVPSLPSSFPVGGFASASILDGINSRRMLFVGTGIDKWGDDVNSIWFLKMNGGELTINRAGVVSTFSGSGNSLFMYDNKLYMYSKNKFYTSIEWGIKWVDGIAKQKLPAGVYNYTDQSVIVKNNTLWILGGKDSGNNYTRGVWAGTLNRLK